MENLTVILDDPMEEVKPTKVGRYVKSRSWIDNRNGVKIIEKTWVNGVEVSSDDKIYETKIREKRFWIPYEKNLTEFEVRAKYNFKVPAI